jgi:hypothetical protein
MTQAPVIAPSYTNQGPYRDQELRFVVRDSPDYFQMKVSVFNDDKKTDLIGETWVNLNEVVVAGGGHNDAWHNLNCKGKYAGEIRMEITYYDSRPKQEKASEKIQQTAANGASDGQRESMTGPRQPKPTPKRRPLPSDPTSASPSPSGTPEHAATQPRPHQIPPPQNPDHKPTPPRGYQTQAHLPDHVQTPSRGYHTTPTHIYPQFPLQAVEYNTPTHDLPQAQHNVEYNSPAYNSPQIQQGYSQSRGDIPGYGNPPAMAPATPVGRHIQDDRYESFDPSGIHQEPRSGGRWGPHEDYIEDHRGHSNLRYDSREPVSELPAPIGYDAPPSPEGPPPPPPVHRSNHASPAVSVPTPNGVYELPQTSAARNPAYRAEQQDAYRHSMPAYGQSSPYQSYSPRWGQDEEMQYLDYNDYQEGAPRHHSYDDRYNEAYRSMQPTVEDVPSSPAVTYQSSYRKDEPQIPLYEERRYDQVPPTAPLNLSSRGSATSGHHSASGSSSQFYEPPPSSVSPLSYKENSHMGSEVSVQSSYSQHSQHSQHSQYSQQSQGQRRQGEDQTTSTGGYVPSLPPTLVAGMDPMIAQEVSERIYMENRANYNQNSTNSSRSRHSDQPQYRQNYPHPHRQQETAAPFVPASASSAAPVSVVASYDQRQNRTYAPIVKPTAISPDPRVPPRKSITPSPVPSPEGRRLSGVPFGPDAYDALNPIVSGAAPVENKHSTVQNNMQTRPGLGNEVETPTKIILQDGREVDPSDHLPETSWAPEPETRGSKQQDNGRARAMPNAGPRPLRQLGRPQSMSISSLSPSYPTHDLSETATPAIAPGRNRLQKKSNRHSAIPATAPQSSPLAPVSTYQDNSFATRSLPRAQTMDFAGENGYGSYGTPTKGGNYAGYGRSSVGAGPPIPAKVPINHGPPPLPPTENAWALLEEMKSIDLGSGRARRKNYHGFA